MSDAVDYFKAYAERAICRARNMRPGRPKILQRAVGRVYHWLSKEAAFGPNTDRMDDFRTAQDLEQTIDTGAASRGDGLPSGESGKPAPLAARSRN